MTRALLVAALVLTGCNTIMQRDAVVRATDMMSNGDYSLALDTLDQVRRGGADDPDVRDEYHLARAQALEHVNRTNEAIDIYWQLLLGDSTTAAAHQARGRLLDLGKDPCARSPH
jgi:hypothetical protein